MFDDDMVAEFYIGGNFDNKLLSMTFYFEADGEDYQIKVVQDQELSIIIRKFVLWI